MPTRLPKTSDEFYADFDPTTCRDRPGYYGYGLLGDPKYGWNGLPVENSYELDNVWVIGTIIGEGLFELLISLASSIVVWRNLSLSKVIKFYLLFYCGYLGIDGLYFLYTAYCSMTFDCVNPSGYPFSGLFLNMIITAFCGGGSVTNTFIDIGLSVNRFFAVCFNGFYYRKAERTALAHCILARLIPVVAYVTQIGTITDESNGFICYMGAYFDPSWFAMSLFYIRSYLFLFFIEVYSMSVVVVAALVLDVVTVWKLKRMVFTSETKRRRDRKLMTMVILIHLFSLIAIIDGLVVQDDNMESRQRFLYIGLPQFICRCAIWFF